MREELGLSVQAIVDADGTATTLPVGPVQYRERWRVDRYTINLSSGRGKFTLYQTQGPSVSPQTQKDFTRSGEGDTSDNNNLQLQVGQFLVAQWTDATPGETGTIVFYGEKFR